MCKLLAVGDLKGLLAKVLGMARMEDILNESGLQQAIGTPVFDGASFDLYRPKMWEAMRTDYPTKIDPKQLKGEMLGDTENPATYLHRQLKHWKQETEQVPERDALMTTMFQNSVVKAMPQPVKSTLEDVVGLNSKTHREFCDHVTHAVEKYRKDEQKLKEQVKEAQRKLTQLQLGELTKKDKKKVQAMVTAEAPGVGPEATVSSRGPLPTAACASEPGTTHSASDKCACTAPTMEKQTTK
ncbi:hypothetical protein AAFF_G00383580 [Aldrovandia affinis]|uniref:Uncharacterized protein n=1 Tax=Aldrovandia affinis TaxID=143900 RepID=A0AAD7SF29_9TELE|nr:hypothetical protein AAFF_G00383580 [Aldrovandia affinis]